MKPTELQTHPARNRRRQLRQAPATDSRSPITIHLALLLLLTAAAYWPTLSNGFLWSDDAHVTGNQNLPTLAGLRDIWFTASSLPQYYPLVQTTFWIEYRLWGLDPRGFHIVNLLLHAANAGLLLLLLRRLAIPGALLAAALFAVHPVHVETVAWISERKNLLSLFFMLAAFLSYLRYREQAEDRHPTSSSRRWYALALGLFVLALFSKIVACALPVVLVITLWWKYGNLSRRDIVSVTPFFIVGTTLGLLSIWLGQEPARTIGDDLPVGPAERAVVAGLTLFFYVGKLIVPANLTFIYPRWAPEAGLPLLLYPLAALALLAGLWSSRHQIGRGPFCAALAFVVMLFPAPGFFDIYPSQFSFVADHFQYHASIPLIILFAAACAVLAVRISPPARYAAAGVLFLVFTTLSHGRSMAYRDPETLWSDTIRRNPSAWMAHLNLGTELELRGKLDEALQLYRQALDLHPGYVEAHNNIAGILVAQGHRSQAETHYREAIALNPDYPLAYYNLANLLRDDKRNSAARAMYATAIRIKPDYSDAHTNLAVLLEENNDRRRAIIHYAAAAKWSPRDPEMHFNLGLAMMRLRRYAEAEQSFLTAHKLNPASVDTMHNLGLCCQFEGRHPEAAHWFEQVLRIEPGRESALKDLKAVQAAMRGK